MDNVENNKTSQVLWFIWDNSEKSLWILHDLVELLNKYLHGQCMGYAFSDE